MMQASQEASGFGRAWFALTVAFALHVLDEATTGFLNVYNQTVTAMRARFAWFPMPTFGFHEWLVGLIAGVVLCFALTPLAARNARWLRPLAWFYALLMFFNGTGHRVFTILGRTVASVTFPRPAPGFYSSPFLFIGSVWLMVRLWKTASVHDFPFARTNSLSS
jgi:surface polysaccharide O-acyltransferase-like enzyme